jgi:RNA-directed DNA polymerase
MRRLFSLCVQHGRDLGSASLRENLLVAWKRVKATKGSAGVDRRTVQDAGEYLKAAWPVICAEPLDGTYRPAPVRRVGIPKPGGGTRERRALAGPFGTRRCSCLL